MEQPSEPIIVGTEFKSPYQWAAKIAPNNLLIPYKNALLWLEGMAFNSIEDLEEKIKEVIYYQEHGSMPYETTPAPFTTNNNNNNNNNNTPQTSSPDTNTTEWNTVKASSRKKTVHKPKITDDELATQIMRRAHNIFKNSWNYAGPTLRISDVYEHFNKYKSSYNSNTLKNKIRLEMIKSTYTIKAGYHYEVGSSFGKGNGFNIKIKKTFKDQSKQAEEKAFAQVHITWE